VNDRCGNSTGSSEVKIRTDTAKCADVRNSKIWIMMIFGQRK